MLAEIEWQQVSSFGQWGFSFLLTIALFYIGSKTKRIETLETEVKRAASEAVDAKIAGVAGELRTTLRVLENVVGQIQQRLESGDQHFKSVDQKCHALELKVMQQVSELTRELATKNDVKELQRSISELQVRLARHPEPSRN